MSLAREFGDNFLKGSYDLYQLDQSSQIIEDSNKQKNSISINREEGSNLIRVPTQISEDRNIQTNSMATTKAECSNLIVEPTGIMQTEVNCSICMEKIEPYKNSALLSCQHRFHKLCIENWLKQNTTCPLCRKVITGLCYFF